MNDVEARRVSEGEEPLAKTVRGILLDYLRELGRLPPGAGELEDELLLDLAQIYHGFATLADDKSREERFRALLRTPEGERRVLLALVTLFEPHVDTRTLQDSDLKSLRDRVLSEERTRHGRPAAPLSESGAARARLITALERAERFPALGVDLSTPLMLRLAAMYGALPQTKTRAEREGNVRRFFPREEDLRRILQFVSVEDYPSVPAPKVSGRTFESAARQKAAQLAKELVRQKRPEDAVALLCAWSVAGPNDAEALQLLAEALRIDPSARIAQMAFERLEGISGDYGELDAAMFRFRADELGALEAELQRGRAKTDSAAPSAPSKQRSVARSSQAVSSQIKLVLSDDEPPALMWDGSIRWRREAPVRWRELDWGEAGQPQSLEAIKARLPSEATEHEVGRFGNHLAATLFGDPPPAAVLEAFAVPSGASRRLVLELSGNARRIPWEYLRIGGRYLLESRVSVVRHVKTAAHARPLRIARARGDRNKGALLFAYANPRGDFDLESEKRRLYEHINDSGFLLIAAEHCTSQKLWERLHDGSQPIAGFYFLGHGELADSGGVLLLHDSKDEREVSSLQGSKLASWLGASRAEFVLIGACHSGEVPPTHQSREDVNPSGVAEDIVRAAGIPVVAMQLQVPQKYSVGFASAFFKNLQKVGYDLEKAVYLSRAFADGERSAFGLPVIYADMESSPAPVDLPERELRPIFVVHERPTLEHAFPKWKPVLDQFDPAARTRVIEAFQALQEDGQGIPTPEDREPLAVDVALHDLLRLHARARDRRAEPPAPAEEPERVAARLALSHRQQLAESESARPGDVKLVGDRDLEAPWNVLGSPGLSRILEKYAYPTDLVVHIIAELKAGRHIMLTGPVGTGKTTVAHEIVLALGYEPHVVTATAEWSAFDVVGGLWPKKQQASGMEFGFRPGVVVEAILKNYEDDGDVEQRRTWRRRTERGCWAIIDELNRADMDRALGALFTALETRRLRVLARTDSGASLEIPIPRDFRIIATVNGADRHYLFRLSDALKRRFAFIEVPVATDYAKEWLVLSSSIEVSDTDGDLVGDLRRFVYLARMVEPIGTAQLKAALRYVEVSNGSGLSEGQRLTQALGGSILPTLEDLEPRFLELLARWCVEASTPELLRITLIENLQSRFDALLREASSRLASVPASELPPVSDDPSMTDGDGLVCARLVRRGPVLPLVQRKLHDMMHAMAR